MLTKIIPKKDCKFMPWKNGQGSTYEIFIHPNNATLIDNNFDYRISSALIQQDSPFSTFHDKLRWLVVFEGEGLKLNEERFPAFEIKHFQGDEKIFGSLLNGPVKDFGIIYDPKKMNVKMSIVNKSEELNLIGENLFFCAGQGAEIDHQKLSYEDSIIFTTPGQYSVNLEPDSKLIWISMNHV